MLVAAADVQTCLLAKRGAAKINIMLMQFEPIVVVSHNIKSGPSKAAHVASQVFVAQSFCQQQSRRPRVAPHRATNRVI